MTPATVVSSPGKVLITGGYLVLDPKYIGTVVSTSSRFYTVIRKSSPYGANRIRVCSPQFLNATWEYVVTSRGTSVVIEDASTNPSKNKFVHLALEKTIAVASEIRDNAAVNETLYDGIDIVVVGDNDFYSQREKLALLGLPRTLDSLSKITPFTPTGVTLSDVHKTGLGSSAALITSLVSALLLHFSCISASSLSTSDRSQSSGDDGRILAHNLAQYVHCLAQGKVGSGFDVAAAIFGSHLYTRFNPAVLHTLMNDVALLPQSLYSILTPSNPAWDHRILPFKLPPLTRIMLADVDAGSDTPSLVGKVLKWRNERPEEALTLWASLDQLNQQLTQTLADLSKLYEEDPENYTASVKYIASLQPIQWGVSTPLQLAEEQLIISKFYEAHQISQAVRAKMREMGRLSEVPIEPSEQTQLLDACVSLAGVVGGGVPGAGGYDAIWLLVCDPVDASPDIRPLERVERTWSTYTALDVSPLSVIEDSAGGVRVEDLESIPGLREIVALK